MKLKSKKVIAVCLMAAMLFTLMPASAMAEPLLIAPNPQATEMTEEKTVIDSIAFDVAAPQAGAVPADEISGFAVEGVSKYDEEVLYWYDVNDPEGAKLTGTFEAGKTYAVIADFRYDRDNYVLAEDLAVTVNGVAIPNEETADSKTFYSVFPDSDILIVQYEFKACPKTVIDSVAFNIAVPQAGAVPAETITMIDGDGLVLADDKTSTIMEWTPFWSDVDNLDLGRVTVFEAGNQYAVAVDFLYDGEQYELADSITATVNGVSFTDAEQLDEKGYAVIINPNNLKDVSVWFEFDRIPEEKDTTSKYSDLDAEAWYYEGAAFCTENGILAGFPDGTFQPNTVTSRAMLAAVLWKLDGSPVVGDAVDYKDVKVGDWYADAVRWAAAQQVATGYGNGVFGPNDAITREQLAAMMYNYAVYKGYDVSVGENTNILSYDDAFDISDWAYPAMQWACGSGLMEPVEEGKIGPSDTVTRAEAAVMVQYFAEQNEVILP